MKSNEARFTVAFNGDDELLPQLAKLSGVESVFGRMSRDAVGGGRPAFSVGDIGFDQLRGSIEAAHRHGLKFIYLLNAPCMGNQELTRSVNRQVAELVDRVVEAGIDGVVVTMPYLLDFIKRRYPRLRVSISTFAYINTAKKARMWEERGADRLILSQDINRNFTALEKIRQAVKCELEIFANSMCLFQCPFPVMHSCTNGHSSNSGDSLKGFAIDYHSCQCATRRLSDPSEFVRGRFVRPEDIQEYMDLGIDVFKLSDRMKLTPWLVRAARAYTSRRYDGNLADLINYPYLQAKGEHLISNPVRLVARTEHVSLELLKLMMEFQEGMDIVHVDNRKLDGFLAHYRRHDCENSICGTDCNHCGSLAAKAVAVNRENLALQKGRLEKLSTMLADGGAFRRDNPAVHLGAAVLRAFSSKKNEFGTCTPLS
jgi:collagenase-like PrtC family protease